MFPTYRFKMRRSITATCSKHLHNPSEALRCLSQVLRPGSKITVVEGDHGSCYWHPETAASVRAWRCLINVQADTGANALIGRELFGLLTQTGYANVEVSPRMIYCDQNDPALKEGFVRNTIIPMVEGVKEPAIAGGMIDETTWNRGIADLHHVADADDGTSCYTFFKAVGELR